MSKLTQKKLKKYIDKAATSNVAKSTRRFFFNHLYESMESRGYFHVDQMYGAGSGVLLKINDEFFVLTARHVIENNIQGELQNESPFWVPAKNRAVWSSQYDFLFPKRVWNVGELISEEINGIDSSDICLVEVFHPQKFHIPDHFIEISSMDSALKEEEFFNGQILLVTGYPFERNSFDFTPQSENITHTTKIQRHTIPGRYIIDENDSYISFDITEGETCHKNVNGMSGGAVYNVQPKANQVKLAGIPVTAGDNICRFIPSYMFIDAIINFRDSSNRTIDPIVDNPPSLEDVMKVTLSYLKQFDPDFKETIEDSLNKAMHRTSR
ncbi:hypothetical protein [Methylicorpusculum sp.]|uniref:hypothetical protein n=1 Tax=Methylicorpusculum sp. TaxID=2713644 RepID=UPI0027246AB0|nr:hypothetical protein [Methylicorpusculum sp.]MDO8845246.1 hypothetical protein [Methylicorpusculum sp.]